MSRRPQRNAQEMAQLEELVIKRKRADPELSAEALGDRLGASHTTVRRILRKHGLATVRVPS